MCTPIHTHRQNQGHSSLWRSPVLYCDWMSGWPSVAICWPIDLASQRGPTQCQNVCSSISYQAHIYFHQHTHIVHVYILTMVHNGAVNDTNDLLVSHFSLLIFRIVFIYLSPSYCSRSPTFLWAFHRKKILTQAYIWVLSSPGKDVLFSIHSLTQ